MFKILLSTILFSGLLLAPALNTAHAQDFGFGDGGEEEEEAQEALKIIDPYDPQYRPNPNIGLKDINKPPSPMPEGVYSVTFKNAMTGREGDFLMSIASPGAVSGCLTTKKPVISKKVSGKKLTIELSSNVVTADSNKTRYGHHTCPVSAASEVGSVILNRDDMIRDQVSEVIIEEEGIGQLASYEIAINQNNVMIKSRFPVYQEPYLQEDKDAATLWFYPAGTMKLFNASIDMENPDTYMQVVGLARKKGLVPLEEAHPGYERLQKISNKHVLVVDSLNRFSNEFEVQTNAFTLGMVNINEVYVGADGPYDRMIEKPVFARLAGASE